VTHRVTSVSGVVAASTVASSGSGVAAGGGPDVLLLPQGTKRVPSMISTREKVILAEVPEWWPGFPAHNTEPLPVNTRLPPAVWVCGLTMSAASSPNQATVATGSEACDLGVEGGSRHSIQPGAVCIRGHRLGKRSLDRSALLELF